MKNIKKVLSILVICIIASSVILPSNTQALTSLSKKGVKTITNKKIDTTPPKRFKPMKSEKLSDWLAVLPDKADRNHNQYIVIPAMGLIAPIVTTPKNSKDYQNAIKGKPVDFNKYFAKGIHQYPGTPTIGKVGNTVLGGHSNFYVSKKTNYTTVFGRLPELDPKDEVWFFVKYTSGWKLLKYNVFKSFETKPTDTKVMLSDKKGRSEFTAYTCTPIGTARNRWIIKGNLIESKSIKE